MDLNESFTHLEELLRLANSLVAPFTYDDELKWLQNKDITRKMFERCPKCFIPFNSNSKRMALFPICNRMAIEDPNVINFSLKFANKLVGKENIDQDSLSKIIFKLEKLKRKFSKAIPKPNNMAKMKARSTKQFTSIKKYLKGK